MERIVEARLVVKRYVRPGETWKQLELCQVKTNVMPESPVVAPGTLDWLVTWLDGRQVEQVKVALEVRVETPTEWITVLKCLEHGAPMAYAAFHPDNSNRGWEITEGPFLANDSLCLRVTQLSCGGRLGSWLHWPTIGGQLMLTGRPKRVAERIRRTFLMSQCLPTAAQA